MNKETNHTELLEAVALLQSLIRIPSFSKQEGETARLLESFLLSKGIQANRYLNNVWATQQNYNPALPTILLNSHHDTVKPNKAYTRDPFDGAIEDGKIYGLGSNDAGGALVSLLFTFLHFYNRTDLKYNLLFAATAEEEISGSQGIEALLPQLPAIHCGIVGEPTQMHLAVAERGLLVLDVTVEGRAGHAAREEGDNALYKAIPLMEWFKNYRFEKESALLGPVKMSVTVIETENKAHNVVPPVCHFVVDVRVNEYYTFEEVLEVIQQAIPAKVEPRSLRMRSSSIAPEHPLVLAGIALERKMYGSPTTSDKALMPFPTLKMGPGDSARSHTADEYIYEHELEEGIRLYRELLNSVV
ncbi:MAG: M20/M25/M40 family metallo-hydrolase [Chitinophagia bacterium]|nr:M20/M25/M40 family metallo-hydrolase [Chitinophagia bacterium]